MGSNSTSLSLPQPPKKHSPSNPLTRPGPTTAPKPEPTATHPRPPRITLTEFITDYCLHSSNSEPEDAKQVLKLLINMNIFKEVEADVYEPCNIEHLYDMRLRVEKLRQTGERLKGAVLDFDAFMGRGIGLRAW
jgi:hypothetical protein